MIFYSLLIDKNIMPHIMESNQRLEFNSMIAQYISLKNGYWEVVKIIFATHEIPIPDDPQEPKVIIQILKQHLGTNIDQIVPGR